MPAPTRLHRVAHEPTTSVQLETLIATLSETNTHLKGIVDLASETLKFFKNIVPWVILAASILWPSVGKIISQLPPVVSN